MSAPVVFDCDPMGVAVFDGSVSSTVMLTVIGLDVVTVPLQVAVVEVVVHEIPVPARAAAVSEYVALLSTDGSPPEAM